MPSIFCDLFEFDLGVLIVCGARHFHFFCDVILLLVFMVCFCFLLSISFYVLILGHWPDKEES